MLCVSDIWINEFDFIHVSAHSLKFIYKLLYVIRGQKLFTFFSLDIRLFGCGCHCHRVCVLKQNRYILCNEWLDSNQFRARKREKVRDTMPHYISSVIKSNQIKTTTAEFCECKSSTEKTLQFRYQWFIYIVDCR